MKKIFKGIGVASIWLSLFIIIQSVVGMQLISYKILNDLDFALNFADVFEPIIESTDNRIEQSILLLPYIMTIMEQIIQPILLISGFIIIGIYLFKTRKQEKKINKEVVNNIPKYIGIAMLLNIIISIICEIMPQSWQELHGSATSIALTGNLFIILLGTGIITPIVEEIIFRHGAMSGFDKSNIKFALFYQALLFGVMHGNPIQSLYAFCLGYYFGLENNKTNSLVPSVIMHITINSTSVMAANLYGDDIKGLIAIFILYMVICLIVKAMKNNKLQKA